MNLSRGERPVRDPVKATREPLDAKLASPRAIAASISCGVDRLRWTCGPSVSFSRSRVTVAAPMQMLLLDSGKPIIVPFEDEGWQSLCASRRSVTLNAPTDREADGNDMQWPNQQKTRPSSQLGLEPSIREALQKFQNLQVIGQPARRRCRQISRPAARLRIG